MAFFDRGAKIRALVRSHSTSSLSPSLSTASSLRQDRHRRADLIVQSGELKGLGVKKETEEQKQIRFQEERRQAREESQRWLTRQKDALNSIAESRGAQVKETLQTEENRKTRAQTIRKRALTSLYMRARDCNCCGGEAEEGGLEGLRRHDNSSEHSGKEVLCGAVSGAVPTVSRRTFSLRRADSKPEILLEEPGGAATIARVRQNIKFIADEQSRASEDVSAGKQRAALKMEQRLQAREQILKKIRSEPLLDFSGLNVEKDVGLEDVCEACDCILSSQEASSNYYLCLTCLSNNEERLCLCLVCYEMREMVHEEQHKKYEFQVTTGKWSGKKFPHIFVHCDAFAISAKPTDGPTAFNLPKIDFHQHCVHEDHVGLMELLKVNAEWNVERCVLLALRPLIGSTTAEVARRNDWVLRMAQQHPQIVPFVTIIEDDPSAPQMFKNCLDRGAKGLKLIGWHSSFIDKYDYDLRHPALMEVFRIAAAHAVPVLLHLFIGHHLVAKGRNDRKPRNYVEDVDAILNEIPGLKMVLAHMGLGFDEDNLPDLERLAKNHPTLYFDTSLYGGYKEFWFTGASARAEELRDFVRRFPKQVLFGSDVFADSAHKDSMEYRRALRASASFLQFKTFACLEFKRTDYFNWNDTGRFGSMAFDPLHLKGLALANNEATLRRFLRQNALDVLGLQMNGAAEQSH